MKYIISGTNRPASRTLQICQVIQRLYAEAGETVGIIDLQDLSLNEVLGHYGDTAPEKMKLAVQNINTADGLIVVCPEYNGSYPGALKYFIDHWSYPASFEYRPVAFVGLGATFGGLRPVEHLQGIFGYRNAFMYPERVFLFNVWTLVSNGEITDPKILDLLKSQVHGFQAFTKALSAAGLDANSRQNKRQ